MKKSRFILLLLMFICFLSTFLIVVSGPAVARGDIYDNIKVIKVEVGPRLTLENKEHIKMIGIAHGWLETPIVVPEGAPVPPMVLTDKPGPRGEKQISFIKDLVEGKKVLLEFDVVRKNHYGTLLAYVFIPVSGKDKDEYEYVKKGSQWYLFLNATIIKAGYDIGTISDKQNSQYIQLFKDLRNEARDNRRGLWQDQDFMDFWGVDKQRHKQYTEKLKKEQFPVGSFRAEGYDWKEDDAMHFSIYYNNASKSYVDTVENYLEENYWAFKNKFGFVSSSSKYRVYIYDNKKDFSKFAGGSKNVAGSAWKDSIVTFDGSSPIERVLSHEFAHVLLNTRVGNNFIPKCLSEGVAHYLEKGTRSSSKSIKASLREAIKKDEFIPFKDILKGVYKNDAEQLFRTESHCLVLFLVEEHMRTDLLALMDMLKAGKDFESALTKAFGYKNITEFEKEWLKYIGKTK
ncbi:MAG: thermonuclease family protein [Candidatus Omnitrophota bacterium]